MRTDFSLFRERLAEACRGKNATESKICQRIGLGARRSLHLALAGPHALDVHRLCQIADVLDVSLDWLAGRSSIMHVPDGDLDEENE
jgi:transcriptional regulator with XRE-family HTH domain